MNNLSWFLYLADVVPTVGSMAGFAGFVALLIVAVSSLLWAITVDDEPEVAKTCAKVLQISASILAVSSVIYALIPSKETIYLIAGSEAGETVVSSEAGQEVLSDIQEIIKIQLEQLKE